MGFANANTIRFTFILDCSDVCMCACAGRCVCVHHVHRIVLSIKGTRENVTKDNNSVLYNDVLLP